MSLSICSPMAGNAPKIKSEGNNRNWAPPLRDLHSKSVVQPKIEIGKPGDKYEQEADTMADKVMMAPYDRSSMVMMTPNPDNPTLRMMPMPKKSMVMMAGNPDNPTIRMKPKVQKNGMNSTEVEEEVQMQSQEGQERIQRMAHGEGEEMVQSKCESCEEETLQKMPAIQKSEDGTTHATPELTSSINNTKGQGSALPEGTSQELGSKMGADFSGIKVHTDTKAQEMNQALGANAFTHGQDIYFNKGKYNAESSQGKHLLAHELTHTIQQGAVGEVVQRDDEIEGKWEQRELESGKTIYSLAAAIRSDYNVTTMRIREISDVIMIKNNLDPDTRYPPGMYTVPGEKYFDGHGIVVIADADQEISCTTEPPSESNKSLTINPTYLHGGSGSGKFATDLAYANQVYAQAGLTFSEGTAKTLNEDETKELLGEDKLLDDNGDFYIKSYTDEEKALMIINKEAGQVTAYYLDDVANSSIYGRAFFESDTLVIASDADERTLAHEVGHLLMGGWHSVNDDNIMQISAKSTGVDCLTDQQIEMIRSHPLL